MNNIQKEAEVILGAGNANELVAELLEDLYDANATLDYVIKEKNTLKRKLAHIKNVANLDGVK
jgi:hypothetical protein